MKIPFLPIVLDVFTSSSTCVEEDDSRLQDSGAEQAHQTAAVGVRTLFFLSHFHTDHLKGLTSSWGVGYHVHHRTIYCSRITRALLVNEFGAGIAPYVVALPLFQWVSLHVSSTYAVRCCLLPACHISGSVQFLFDTYLGRVLYTGDVKVNPALMRLMKRVVDATGPVDHLFIDDTWLHLDKGAAAAVDASSSTLSRLLSDEQLEEAFAAVEKRVAPLAAAWKHQAAVTLSPLSTKDANDPHPPDPEDHQAQERHQQQQQQQDANAAQVVSRCDDPLCHPLQFEIQRSIAQLRQRPYVLRIYLHNHFGKEVILQRLAQRLGTTILVDDARYKRLQAISSTLPPTEAQTDLCNFLLRLGALLTDENGTVANVDQGAATAALPLLSSLSAAQTDAKACWDAETVDMDCFVPYSRAVAHWSTSVTASSGSEGLEGGSTYHGGIGRRRRDSGDASETCGTSLSVSTTLTAPMGCIEIVNSRALISPSALESASAAGTPHYGIVMTGWAKLHRRELARHERLWQIPYTMHSTPEGLVALVSLLRPQSITPLHYDRQRGFLVLAKLGSLLRVPYVNSIMCASTLQQAAVPLSLQRYVFGSLHRHDNESGGKNLQTERRDPARNNLCRRHRVQLRACSSEDDDDEYQRPSTSVGQRRMRDDTAYVDEQHRRQTPLRCVPSNVPAQTTPVAMTPNCSLSQLADEYCGGGLQALDASIDQS